MPYTLITVVSPSRTTCASHLHSRFRRAAPGTIQYSRRCRILTCIRLSVTSPECLLFPLPAFSISFISHSDEKVKARIGYAPAFPDRDVSADPWDLWRLFCADTGAVDKGVTRRRRPTGSSVREGASRRRRGTATSLRNGWLDRRLLTPTLLDSGSWLCRFPSGFCPRNETHSLGHESWGIPGSALVK